MALRYFFPSVVILLLSMLAIHSSLHLLDGWENIYIDYDPLTGYDDLRVDALISGVLALENRINWSVAAMGTVGFILLFLNARKMQRLDTLNREKKAALKLLENRLAAMEACLEGIGIVDAEGNLTYMNRALMELHGVKPHEAELYIGKSWLNLYSQKGQEYARGHVLKELEKNGNWRGRSSIVRLDGKIIQAQLAITLLPDGGFVGTARDVTEQLKTEREKKELQDQFYHAQKMEAIGRLAGGIAHDFNNILAAMNGYSEFLIDDLEEGSEVQAFARSIHQAGLQARSLVDGILAFSRRAAAEAEVFDLRTPLEECLSMLRASMPKTIEIRSDIEGGDFLLEGNSTRIAQAIMNICVNAKDAMEDEKGVLTVGLGRVGKKDVPESIWALKAADPGSPPPIRLTDMGPGETRLTLGVLVRGRDYACLSIEDTGCGISRVVMEHIFEPFFTTKPIDKGTGLGMPTVHGVIASSGGAMIIHSRLGIGTRFDLFFPLTATKAEEGKITPHEKASRGAGRILLVDDQDEVRRMNEIRLGRIGYSVVSAVSGQEALDILRQEKGDFDLMLTDQNMPEMTGLELAQRAQASYPDLKFVILSGYSQERVQELIREHPLTVSASLRKPVSQNVLARTLAEVLGES